MIGWILLAMIPIAYIWCIRLIAYLMYASNKRTFDTDYDNRDYEHRDSPHFEEWMLGGVISLGLPVTLPVALFMTYGGSKKHWEQTKVQHAAETRLLAEENVRLQGIIDELNAAYPVKEPNES